MFTKEALAVGYLIRAFARLASVDQVAQIDTCACCEGAKWAWEPACSYCRDAETKRNAA